MLEDATYRESCERAIEELVARHGWRLLDGEAWLNSALNALEEGIASTPERAAFHAYCLALYRACAGAQGRSRRELGYQELFRLLYARAWQRAPAAAEEVAQEAIERVYEQFERCRVPGAFVAFALLQLREVLRQRWRGEAIEHDLRSFEEMKVAGTPLVDRQPGPLRSLLAQEQRATLHRLVESYLRRYPRSVLQLAALLMESVDGLEERLVNQLLNKSSEQLAVLRSRARARLRSDADWQAWAIELGVPLEEQPGPATGRSPS